MFLYLLTTITCLIIIHILFNYNRTARLMRKIPGPKIMFISGNMFYIIIPRAERFKFLRKWAKECNNTIWRIWSFPLGAVSIYKPEDIEIILSGTKHNQKSIIYKFLRPWLQDGLLLSFGTKWQNRRKILTPAFHFNILRRFCPIIEENCSNLVVSLNKTEGKPVDVVKEISQFTLHTICETAMGTQLRNEKSESGMIYQDAICRLGDVIVHRLTRIYLYLDFIFSFTKTEKLQQKTLKIIHNFTSKVVNRRRIYVEEHGNNIDQDEGDDEISLYKKKTAMLDLLILAEKQGLIYGNGIQEEVDTFMFEGHDTTACGLTYFMMILANDITIQDKIVRELKDIFGESKRKTTIMDLSRMHFLERCIKESLRLYPPVHLIARVLSEEVKLSGYTVPEGMQCLIHIYDLHRNKDLYPDPLVFDPDRFLPENSATRHPYAYLPFSAGPRNCIGQRFAMMEMKCVITEILRNFVLLPVTKEEDLDLLADLVLRNSGPVYVSFVKRLESF